MSLNPSVCFFTVCGGGEDYEFLLGSIEHHAAIGRHIVLDTTPKDRARTFSKLPATVQWIHEPIYGHGRKEFKLRTAVERAAHLAKESGADVIVYLDSDEFFILDDWVIRLATDRLVEVNSLVWKPDGKCYDCGESEWHVRLWPGKADVRIARNEAWLVHPDYNGNPEYHPVVVSKVPSIRAHGPIHHHLHYAIGEKASDLWTAKTTIPGFFDGNTEVDPVPWPEPLVRWRDYGILPSQAFV